MTTEKTFEGKFRIRWFRWLGQVCRIDRHGWTELLSSNWICWVEMVYEDSGITYKPIGFMAAKETVYKTYKKAIEICSLKHMQKLDGIYCESNIEKRYQK